jgi:hypothetical protein
VPASISIPVDAVEALNLPAFRPLSFLSALADRVIPEDEEPDGLRPRPAQAALVRPSADPLTNGVVPVETPPVETPAADPVEPARG